MAKITNLESYIEPETTLFPQEVDVIIEVVTRLLESEGNPSKGTFILDGHKRGEDPQCLIKFNLRNGHMPAKYRNVKHEPGKPDTEIVFADSNTLAADAIEGFLEMPSYEDRYFAYYAQHEFASGIHIDSSGERKALCLNTTNGRFLCSFYAAYEDGGHEQSTRVLLAVSETIAQMGEGDLVLQESNRLIWQKESKHEFLRQWISVLFRRCESPALKAWKKWHEPANNPGELTLYVMFFE